MSVQRLAGTGAPERVLNTPSQFDLKGNAMNLDLNTARLVGAAQLTIFVASILGERLLASVVGSGDISDKLLSISGNITRMRISILLGVRFRFVGAPL